MAIVFEEKRHLTLRDIPEFSKSLLKRIQSLLIDSDSLFDIRLSLEEALVNAIKYGNKFDDKKFVFVKIKASAESVEIEVKDQGEGFDYNAVPLPTESQNISKPSGRGIFLIKNLMDSVEFFDGGRGIKMVKWSK